MKWIFMPPTVGKTTIVEQHPNKFYDIDHLNDIIKGEMSGEDKLGVFKWITSSDDKKSSYLSRLRKYAGNKIVLSNMQLHWLFPQLNDDLLGFILPSRDKYFKVVRERQLSPEVAAKFAKWWEESRGFTNVIDEDQEHLPVHFVNHKQSVLPIIENMIGNT